MEFGPSRIKENGVDLNRDFYNPADVHENVSEFRPEPEIDFLLHLIERYDPSHFVVMHSPLNFLELDGYSTKEDREWMNRVYDESGKFGGSAIPIKKFETYAGKKHKHWSFGHLIKVIQKTALTFEYPEPKKSSSEAIKQDGYYRKAVKMALDIDSVSLAHYRKETELIKNMSLEELAEYAHNYYGHPSKELYVVGITGTNGKTTVSYLIGEVLKGAGLKPFVLGTLNSGNRDLSTPEAIDTLRLMRTHLDQGGTHFIMEVTSEGIDQFRNVLNTVKILSKDRRGNLFVLFGCGGNRDRGKRPKMGKIASDIADFIVITDDNPRSEVSQDIMNEIVGGIPSHYKNYILIQDRKKAIAFIINKAQDLDVVILVGKGHETYQILKSETIYFDDREEAREAIMLRFKKEVI